MKENKYDDPIFFEQYSNMQRSIDGLEAAGEWHLLKDMMPSFEGKRVLDLGCGFGWHCKYAVEHGAAYVLGVDISSNMIRKASEINALPQVEYRCMPIEDIVFEENSFDIVISSLAIHYIDTYTELLNKVYHVLAERGHLVMSVEHPIFTSYGTQDWWYGENAEKLHWPVDRYFEEGKRSAGFLGETVTKYHRTLTTYLGELLSVGFELTDIKESLPSKRMLEQYPAIMKDEFRRPMMLLISARKR